MASYTVKLTKGPLSLTVGARKFEKGKPVPLSDSNRDDAELIKYCRNNSLFTVTAPKAAPVAVATPPEPEDAEDEEVEDEEGEEETDDVYTREALDELPKGELKAIAAEMELEVDGRANKEALIDAILEGQEAGEEEDEEDED